jgi:hypothetical protein
MAVQLSNPVSNPHNPFGMTYVDLEYYGYTSQHNYVASQCLPQQQQGYYLGRAVYLPFGSGMHESIVTARATGSAPTSSSYGTSYNSTTTHVLDRQRALSPAILTPTSSRVSSSGHNGRSTSYRGSRNHDNPHIQSPMTFTETGK